MEHKGDRNSFILKGDEGGVRKQEGEYLIVSFQKVAFNGLVIAVYLLVFSFFPDLFTACQSEHSQSTALNFTLEIQT